LDENQTVFDELEQAIALLRSHFLTLKGRDVDELKMARKALAAMLATLGDPFTNYIPPAQFDQYRSRKQEQVVGVGLQLESDLDDRVRVISALRGSPADIPQVQTGYELAEVNGSAVRGMDNGKLHAMLNGEAGTTVKLMLRTPSGTEITVAVARKAVELDYIRWQDLGEGIVMARVAWFSGTGYTSFIDTLKQFTDEGAKGLVLDLRTNSGGSIIATRNIFSSLCNEPVMYFGKKRNQDKIPDRILGEHQFDIPVVVLVNEATFSAGEVLAGALQDHRRATLVGEPTGGKGSMQQVFPLEGQIGGALRITTATNCTPSGRIVQDQGIVPDITVPQLFPELFVDDGPQNISDRGRNYLKQLRLQRLLRKHDPDQVDAPGPTARSPENSDVMTVWQEGDQQLKRAIQHLNTVASAVAGT